MSTQRKVNSTRDARVLHRALDFQNVPKYASKDLKGATMEDYASKTVVITGGTSGLGLALARILGKRGARIVITGRRAEKGDAAVASLGEKGIEAKFVQQDVTSEEDWNKLAFTVKQEYGTVDYLFNNAGVMLQPNALMKTTLEDWRWIVDTNFWGSLYGLRIFGGLMFTQPEGGRIVTTASTAGVSAFSGWAPYSVTKTALVRLVENYQTEAAKFGLEKVKYNVSLPGVFESDIANSTLHRGERYNNIGGNGEEMPQSAAHTEAGDRLGMLTADETAQIILDQIDEGRFYLLPHADLTERVVSLEAEALNNDGQPCDQAIVDFAFYAEKLAAQGITSGGDNVDRLTMSN